MMLRGVVSSNSEAVFECVRCCIASDLDKVEMSTEGISEVPVSRSDCNWFSQSRISPHCIVPHPSSVQG